MKYLLLITSLFATSAAGLWWLSRYALDQWTRPRRIHSDAHPRDYGLPFEDVGFRARDGLELRGWFIPPAPNTHVRADVAVIFCHGHGGTKAPDLIYAPWFHARGIPLLLFDFRNHGASEGALTSMGFYERRDVLGAVDFMLGRGYTRLGLFGFSMGGAVAIASAPLSPHVVCVVADSPFAELQPTLARAIQVHGFPRWFAVRFIELIFWLGRQRLQCDLEEALPVRAVTQLNGRALLIILGEYDEYIETWQGQRLYERASEPKEFWLVPNVSHRAVDRYRPAEYQARVMGFFERWLLQNGEG